MSLPKGHRTLSIFGWLVGLFAFNLLVAWPQNADKTSIAVALAAIDSLLTVPQLVLTGLVVYGIIAARPLMPNRRLAGYISAGLAAAILTLVLSYHTQFANAFIRMQEACRHLAIVGNRPLSPEEVFRKVSPSVFVVETLDENGKPVDLGSGVAIGRDFLITNCHVVQSGASLRVGHDKGQWTARLIRALPGHDLCGLKPAGLDLKAIETRPSSGLVTGQRVYAIGSPEGLELTFSEGVISALRETDGVHVIQTSAPISPGSSGGGLFDTYGDLVGITTFQLKEGQSLNFALPGEWVVDASGRNSSTSPSDEELESKAWLDIGVEAIKTEDYGLAGPSLRKCADLKQVDAPRALVELGHLAEMAAGLNSPSDAFKSWLRQYDVSSEKAESMAMTDFEKAIELNPGYAEPWIELARVHMVRNDHGLAVSAAKEATRLAPGDWNAWMVLGESYIDAHSYPEAIEALQRGEAVAPDKMKPTMRLFVGSAYAKNGDREQVLRIYRELKTSDPKAAEYFFKWYVLPAR